MWQLHRRILTSGVPSCLLHVTHLQRYRKKLCSDRERVLGKCVLYGEMASLPIWKAGHNCPLQSSASGDHFSRNLWVKLHAGFREWCWDCRTMALLFSSRKGKGSSWPTLSRAALSDGRMCGSHTDGPVTKHCQTRYNESDQRRDYERPILDDTEESGAWWLALPKEWSTGWNQSLLGLTRFLNMMECSSNLIKS